MMLLFLLVLMLMSAHIVHAAPCAQGTYSVDGNEPTPGDPSSCDDCNPGYSTTSSGTVGFGASDCTVCAAGYGGSTSDGATGCNACSTGNNYKVDVGNTACTSCDNNATGCTATSAGQCAAGYGGDAATGCTVCTDGTDYKVAAGNTACTSCDNNATGCTAISAGQCPAGYDGDAADSNDVCTVCVDGTFNASAGNDGTCTAVQNGYFGNNGAAHVSSGATAETACPNGTYNADGAGSCDSCPVGTYGDVAGLTQCVDCVAGKYRTTTGATAASHCIDCVAGKFSDSVAAGASSTCIDCVYGTYSADDGASECTFCPSGSTAIAGQSECELSGGVIAAVTIGVLGTVAGGAYVYSTGILCSSAEGAEAVSATDVEMTNSV